MTGREGEGYQTPGEEGDDIILVSGKSQIDMGSDLGLNGRRPCWKNEYYEGVLIDQIPPSASRHLDWRLWQIQENGHVIMETKDTVAFLVYNRDRNAVAFVAQRRPAVSLKDGMDGLISEVPAGHIENYDIDNPRATMAREANEELGARFDPDDMDFELIGALPMFVSPGHATERMWLGYVEADNDMFDQSKSKFGASHEGEETLRVWVPVNDLPLIQYNDLKTFALVQWFLLNKYPYLAKR